MMNILKTFQLFLKAIPGWDIDTIKKEVERIMVKTKEQPWLINLIQTGNPQPKLKSSQDKKVGELK